jgi:hypothetical protein
MVGQMGHLPQAHYMYGRKKKKKKNLYKYLRILSFFGAGEGAQFSSLPQEHKILVLALCSSSHTVSNLILQLNKTSK